MSSETEGLAMSPAYKWQGKRISFVDTPLKAVVTDFLGEGTFGRVNKARCSDGRIMAAKLLKHEKDKEKEEQLAWLSGLTSLPSAFLGKPQHYGRTADGHLYYLMNFLPAKFRKMNDFVSGKKSLSLQAAIRACYNLADSFASLHLKNCCEFHDLSSNQVAITSQGEIAIVDCDNIGHAGLTRLNGGTLAYLPLCAAKGAERASMYTDAYALGVLLFQLMTGGHPISGMKEMAHSFIDNPTRRGWYLDSPSFVFAKNRDEALESCEFEKIMVARWNRLPQLLRDTFSTHFNEGFYDSRLCVLEPEWRELFATLEDSVFECCRCGKERILDSTSRSDSCPACKHSSRPGIIEIRRLGNSRGPADFKVAVGCTTNLYAHHVKNSSGYDFTVSAQIVQGDKQNPKFVGLRNTTDDIWTVRYGNGTRARIMPRAVTPLPIGTSINFPGSIAVLV